MNRLVPNLYQGFLLLFRGPKKFLVRFGYQFEGVRIESLAKINGSRGSISARQGWSRRPREKMGDAIVKIFLESTRDTGLERFPKFGDDRVHEKTAATFPVISPPLKTVIIYQRSYNYDWQDY